MLACLANELFSCDNMIEPGQFLKVNSVSNYNTEPEMGLLKKERVDGRGDVELVHMCQETGRCSKRQAKDKC